MAARFSVGTTAQTAFHFNRHITFLAPVPNSLATSTLPIPKSVLNFERKKPNLTICVVVEDEKLTSGAKLGLEDLPEKEIDEGERQISAAARVAEKLARMKSERFTYLVAAVMSSFRITSMAVYCRFSWQMEGGEVPYAEIGD